MKRFSLLLVVLVVFSLAALVVHADYNFYPSYGDNGQITRNTAGNFVTGWPVTFSRGVTNGSEYEPLAGDFNGNGVEEIVAGGGSGNLNLYRGTTQTLYSQLFIGTLSASPASCDINGDGNHEVVALASYNGTNYLYVIGVNSDTGLSILSSTTTTMTGLGNVICDKFYSHRGDTTTYALFVDLSKNLHVVPLTTTGVTDNFFDVGGSVAAQQSSASSYQAGGSDIVVSSSFDPYGDHAALWVSGNKLFKYSSLRTSDSITIPGSYLNESLTSIHVLGGVHDGGSQTDVLVYQSGQRITSTNMVSLFRDAANFGSSVLQFVGSTDANLYYNGGNNAVMEGLVGNVRLSQGYAVTSLSGGRTEIVGVAHPTNTLGAFNVVTGGATYRVALNPTNLSTDSFAITTDSTDPTDQSFRYVGGLNDHVFVINGHDIIYMINDNLAGMSTSQANYSDLVNFLNTTVADVQRDRSPPIPIDVDRDGFLDLVESTNSTLREWMTGGNSATKTLYPFSVREISSGGGGEITQVTTGFNDTNQEYRYSVACTNQLYYQWNNAFGYSYNFTGNRPFVDNVTTTVPNPDSYLVLNAWSVPFTINSTFVPEIDFYSPPNTPSIHSNAVFNMEFSVNDSSYALLLFNNNDDVTDYLEFTRSGTVMTIEDVIPGGTRSFVGNATVGNHELNLTISYVPKTNTSTNQEYFVKKSTKNFLIAIK